MTKQEYKEIENLLKQAGKKLDSMSKGEKTPLYSRLKNNAILKYYIILLQKRLLRLGSIL